MTNATLQTNHGAIDVELYDEDAPKTVENFRKLAQDGFYDGVIFHRVINDFMIQGGDPTGTGSGRPGYQFEDEFNDRKVEKGALAMANAGPNTNGSQFFIVTADACPWLDGKHTVSGRVTSGMDVVSAIQQVDVGPETGRARMFASSRSRWPDDERGRSTGGADGDRVPSLQEGVQREPDRRLGRAVSWLQVPALRAVRAGGPRPARLTRVSASPQTQSRST